MKLIKVTRVFDRILDIGAFLAAIMITFAFLAICAQIILRYFWRLQQLWVIDVSTILLVYITFLASAWLLRTEGHVKMDLVINRLSPKQQSILNTVTSSISTIIFIVQLLYVSVVEEP